MTAFPPASRAFSPIFLCSSPDILEKILCLASLDALGVRILSIHCWMGVRKGRWGRRGEGAEWLEMKVFLPIHKVWHDGTCIIVPMVYIYLCEKALFVNNGITLILYSLQGTHPNVQLILWQYICTIYMYCKPRAPCFSCRYSDHWAHVHVTAFRGCYIHVPDAIWVGK